MSNRLKEVVRDSEIADNKSGEYEAGKVEFYHEHVDWLIEQANLAIRLSKKNEKLKAQKRKFMDNATQQRKKKQRCREALKFYADEDIYELEFESDTFGTVARGEILYDEGEEARKALEESE